MRIAKRQKYYPRTEPGRTALHISSVKTVELENKSMKAEEDRKMTEIPLELICFRPNHYKLFYLYILRS